MDGNRRWAKAQGLHVLAGHQRGSEVWEEMMREVRDLGIPNAVFYVFSTENWRRSEAEVGHLMDLFKQYLSRLGEKVDEQGVRVRVIGRQKDFSPEMQVQLADLEERSAQYSDTTIWLALSYGGRSEIVTAVNQAIAAGQPVDETRFEQFLWTADMPDPDLIIRTGGERRLSNFVTWRSVYSELFFTDTYWPAFTKAEFHRILDEYVARERRHGR